MIKKHQFAHWWVAQTRVNCIWNITLVSNCKDRQSILYLYSLRRILDLRKKAYNVYHKEAVEFTLFIYTQKTYSTYIFQYVLSYGWYSSNKIICATELRFLCVLCKLNSGCIQQLTEQQFSTQNLQNKCYLQRKHSNLSLLLKHAVLITPCTQQHKLYKKQRKSQGRQPWKHCPLVGHPSFRC